MKHIIFILLLISPFVVSAQYPAPTRSNASVQPIDVRHKAGLNEIVPVYNDTVQANLPYNIGNDSIGAIIFTRDANALWYRTKQKYWSLIGTGSGSGQLFAVGDSTATGTRYFNQKNNAFIYDSAGSHVIVAYDTFNHYFTKFYLDTTYTYLQVSSNDFNTFGSISVTKGNATMSASSPDSGHQVVVNNGNVTVRDLRNHPSKLVITGISTGTDTVFAPTQILVLQGDTVKSARYPSLSPTDTANLSYRIDTVGKIIYIDTTQYLRFNLTDSILYSIPVNGVFANGLISTGGINLLDSTITILPNIVFVRNDTTYTLTSSASFIINSTATGYYRTDLIYIDSNNIVQHLVGIEDTVITVPPSVPYKGIGVAIVNVHNSTISSTVIPTNNNWVVGATNNIVAGADSTFGTASNTGIRTNVGGVGRSLYPREGGFLLYGIGTTQMNAIVSPLAGTIVYNNDSTAYCYYNGSIWQKMGSGSGGGGGTITHAVDSLYTLSDSLLLVHYSPYNRTDTFSWRGSSGGSTYTAGTNISIDGSNIISSYDSTSFYNITQPNDTTLVFNRRNGVNDTLDLSSTNVVDSIWRTPGIDSIKYSIGGRLHAIKDSTGVNTSAWNLGGNSGLTYTQAFIGSSTFRSMNFKVNDTLRAKIDSSGSTNFYGLPAGDNGRLGTELTTTGSGTNWSGSGFSSGYTHTTGSTTALTTSTVAVSSTYYYFQYTITGRTAGSVTIAFGGLSFASISATNTQAGLSTSTATLTITPTTDFDGTIVLSVKAVSASIPNIAFYNSSAQRLGSIRISGDSSNVFMGVAAGSQNISTSSLVTENTAIGYNALSKNIIGKRNTAVGKGALQVSLSDNNVAIGYNALGATTTGSGIAIGAGVLSVNTTGSANVSVGGMANNSNGSSNTSIGASSLNANTTGSNNVGVGWTAMGGNTTGSNNVGVGYGAVGTTTGGNNTGIGFQALGNNATASNNVSVGFRSSFLNTTGTSNSIVGTSALFNNTVGSSHAALGYAALQGNTVENGNTAVGNYALNKNGAYISALGAITPGSDYVDGYYIGVTLTLNPAGAAMVAPIANIVVSGGAVTSVTLTNWGFGVYSTVTSLTCANTSLGGTGSGWSVAVTTITPGGSYNIAIGDSAAAEQHKGSYNIAIGHHVNLPDTGKSAQLNIGNAIYADSLYSGTSMSSTPSTGARVGIGVANPDASAKLEIASTTKGFLPPRMTATQASAIPSPAKALMVYVTNTNGTFTSAGLWIYTTTWKLIIAE